MMTHTELLGTHYPNNGSGITIQDLLNLLQSIPRQARDNYMMVATEKGDVSEVIGLQISQSDQAEKWEFKVYVKLEYVHVE